VIRLFIFSSIWNIFILVARRMWMCPKRYAQTPEELRNNLNDEKPSIRGEEIGNDRSQWKNYFFHSVYT
jgi:hypothetical protein